MNFGIPKVTGVLPAIRLIFADVLGDDDSPVPVLPAELPVAVRPVAAAGVQRLLAYQGPGYAQLYVDRLKRFIGRRGLADGAFAEIARLLTMRMAYDDAIEMAQAKLAEAEAGHGVPPDDVRKLRLDEMVSSLPDMVADPVLWFLDCAGWLHWPITLRFSAATHFGLRRLKIEAALKRWRLSSGRYARERALTERWLHMIDRGLTRQPGAVTEIVRSAEMLQGYGDDYRQALRDWNQIIDGLVKPVLDGVLQLSDLAGAIVEARAAVRPDPRQVRLKEAIAAIRARAVFKGRDQARGIVFPAPS
ncbi:MAG TPA: DUF6537 domain-containing protein [Nitrobacter sp.]|nr:DUF6537 domain-containing protein [Nitrobacter sp.]